MHPDDRLAQARELHRRYPVVDCHNDSIQAALTGDVRYNPLRYRPARPRRLGESGESGHWDFPRARQAGQSGQMTNLLVPWVKDGPHARRILRAYRQLQKEIAAAPEQAVLARTAAEVELAHREGRVAVLLAIEGAEGIEGELDLLHVYHQLGVRSLGLTWMYRNEVAEGNWEDTGAGLSPFGRQVVREMNQLGMLVDVAHATEQTFWDTLEESSAPVVCTHTACRSLVRNFGGHAPSRYLTDDQMRALAAQDGVLGIFFSVNRELDDDAAGIAELARFFAHAAEVCGADHVGFGSDLDGGFPPRGMADVRALPELTAALLELGFSEPELAGILGGNWLRVYRRVWGG
ncbi:MAG: membrane dipeptidase [Armatimonadetes bacterium]|nr:membrane dipeptidase [Armatimonadota bacterium]